MRLGVSTFFALLVLMSLPFGCEDRSTAVKDELKDLPRSGSFTWVSTSVIYSTVIQKKPASLLIITRSDCIACDSLEQRTLRDSTVMGMINAWFNAAIISADSDSLIVVGDSTVSCRTAAREVFHVDGYPTTLFFDSRGQSYTRVSGYYAPSEYADILYLVYSGLNH